MRVKQTIKKTKAYQTYWCIKKYNRYRKASKATAFMTARPVYYNSIDKADQIDRLISSVEIKNCGHGNFFYSIDERSIPFHMYKVIENMPINYSEIIQHSLFELLRKSSSANNNIGKNNCIILRAMVEYIDRAIQTDPDAIPLKKIKESKASTLEEALQRILFVNQFFWQTGHKLIGLGRLDKVLDAFPESYDEELLIVNFLKTLHEHYYYKSSVMPGDTGQIILLGGEEEDGSFFNNRFTFKIIDCLRKTNIPDPKILLRVSHNTPVDLLTCATECIATGIGSPLLSNDDVVIPCLMDFGYTTEDAFDYGVSACWEPLSIGRSLEQNNIASILYGRAIYDACTDKAFVECERYQDVLSLFLKYVNREIKEAVSKIDRIEWEPDPLMTLFSEDCLDKNLDISAGGAKYNNYGLLSEGMASAVNSLININYYCFETKQISLETIRKCINENYEGYDKEKNLFSRTINGFGTDSEEAINLTNEIIDYTISILKDYRNHFGGMVKFGLSSPNYVRNGLIVGATVDGRKAFAPFSTHISRDTDNPFTEIANFASKLHYNGYSANANVVDIITPPNMINDNTNKFVKYLNSIIKEGVFQIQFNVLSYETLLDAKAHPENYQNLIVRVWGFSAYFNDLPTEYQNQLIARAKELGKTS